MNQVAKLAGVNAEKRVVRDISADIKPDESITSTCSKHQTSLSLCQTILIFFKILLLGCG